MLLLNDMLYDFLDNNTDNINTDVNCAGRFT